MLIDLYILCIYVICVLIIRWYMTETDFLDDYDPTAFERPSVTVDLVLLGLRSEEHTSELQSIMRNSYAVFCFKKKTIKGKNQRTNRERKRPTHKQTVANGNQRCTNELYNIKSTHKTPKQ